MDHGHAVQEELREPARALRRAIPAVHDGYRTMHAASSLDQKTKDLIALAIAVSTQCDGCSASHARGAVRTGATESEVAEALAIAMNGGPGTVHGPRAFAAYRKFAERVDPYPG